MKKKLVGRLLSGALCLTMLFALAGCGSGSGSEKSVSAVEAIKKAGVLKVGVKADVPKYSFLNPETNTYEGFEPDLAAAIAQKILGDSSKVQFSTVNAKTRGPLLDKGDIDMVIATFTITEERKKSYDFSDAYMTDAVGFLVKKDSGIKNLSDMDGKTIGVAQSATSRGELEQKAKEEGINLKFSEFATYPEIKSALDSGRVQVFSVDKSILNGYIDENTEILEDSYAPQEYGVATKKGNDDLAELVNKTISQLKDTKDMQKMLDNWEIQ